MWLENGNRLGSYGVDQVRNGTFKPVIKFTPRLVNSTPKMTMEKISKLIWLGGKIPLSTPRCGFEGDLCKGTWLITACKMCAQTALEASLVLTV